MAGSENEPNNSSSGEEEEVSSEGSESESEPNKTSTPPPSSKKFQLTPNSSSDESDSLPDPSIKHSASKPMGSKKARSKNPTSRYSPPPIKASTGKRPPAVADGGDLKRAKKKPAPDAVLADIGGEKKLLFQRLWSEDNEIELIQGMINYVEEKGKDPVANVIDFHEFVKKSLHVDVNDRQVLAKVRRLKKKFENNVARVEKNGKVRSFSNPHEKKMYDLSKNLWGNDSSNNVVMSSKKVNAKVKATPKTNKSRNSGSENGEVEVPMNEVKPKVGQPVQFGHGLGQLDPMGLQVTDEGIMRKGLELLSGAKKAEMEGKWKNLKVQEIEHFLKKVDILKEQAEVVLNAITKSGGR